MKDFMRRKPGEMKDGALRLKNPPAAANRFNDQHHL
jgi:hypothetical protein